MTRKAMQDTRYKMQDQEQIMHHESLILWRSYAKTKNEMSGMRSGNESPR